MVSRLAWLSGLDRALTRWMADRGVFLLRISVGLVFLWFGVLKFVPGLSPADELATATIDRLTLGIVPAGTALIALAVLETAIGLGLLTGRAMRVTLLLLFGQMLGTATPLVIFPELTWSAPLVPTLEGQYIIKNLVLVSAGLVIGATVRGGGMVEDAGALEAGRRLAASPR
jgi:uncharacterized membrane protein YphA (DoxX/SURF4 family)